MEIKTVELTEFGNVFIVNRNTDQLDVPNDMGNRHRVMVQEWIDAGNTPTPSQPFLALMASSLFIK